MAQLLTDVGKTLTDVGITLTVFVSIPMVIILIWITKIGRK